MFSLGTESYTDHGAIDVAPFGLVVTSDPERIDGCRASRIEEFQGEDVFLESEVASSPDGTYPVPRFSDGKGCFGIRWIERRQVRQVLLEFAVTSSISPNDVRMQYWVGESLWQGSWRELEIEPSIDRNYWRIDLSRSDSDEIRLGTRKIRFIFPPRNEPVFIRRISAFTDSKTQTREIVLRAEEPFNTGQGEIRMYNGEFIGDSPYELTWYMAEPLPITVRHSVPSESKADRTVIRLLLPTRAFGIAMDDLLANGSVYVKDFGIFATTDASESALTDYKQHMKGRQTILERVREMPDQTFEQAMTRTHNPIQNNGPTMLSLACDNRKFIVHQSGWIEFPPITDTNDKLVEYQLNFPSRIYTTFGFGEAVRPERHLEGGWLPIVVSTYQMEGVTYRQRAFVTPFDREQHSSPWLNGKPLCVAEFSVRNPGDQEREFSIKLEFDIRSDTKEHALVTPTSNGAVAEVNGLIFAVLDSSDPAINLRLDDGHAFLTGSLSPGQSARCYLYIPGWRMNSDEHEELTGGAHLVDDVRVYWERVFSEAANIDLPDPVLTNVIRASQVHCLLAARNETDGERIAPWIASMHYGPLESEGHSIIRGMDFLGHEEFARRSLDFFIKRYNPEGFLTTGYTMMGTGWHLWSLGEHFDLSRNSDWLRQNAAEIMRVCEWIVRQRDKTKNLDAHGEKVPEYGLVPPGVQADWNAFSYHFSLSGYYYAGLLHAGRALAEIGHPGSNEILRDAEAFRQDILHAYERTQSIAPVYPLREGSWVPAYPGQVHCPGPTNDFFPGDDANRSWCYDVELGAHQLVAHLVLDPESREVHWMMDHMEHVQYLAEGWHDYPAEASENDWFNLGGFSKVQPYYCRNAEIYAMQDDVKPFLRTYFNSLASLLNTENLWLWEHFNNISAWNKTHETGYFLHHTRLMLLMERGDQLWLAPLVTNNWLQDGMVISVQDSPTRFGKVSYRIVSHVADGFIEAVIDSPDRKQPREIVIRLRHPEGKSMQSVEVDGKEHHEFDPEKECVYIRPSGGRITVRAEYDG